MENLILEFIPHDPSLGLYVVPGIPFDKLHNAIQDYAPRVLEKEVIALYDATLMGSAKDGALFLEDRFVFQNNNLEPAYEVHYTDLVDVELEKKIIGGQKLNLSVNRGRATISMSMDFSGKAKAAPYVARFLETAMFQTADAEMSTRSGSGEDPPKRAGKTNVRHVEKTLLALMKEGHLSEDDFQRMMRILNHD